MTGAIAEADPIVTSTVDVLDAVTTLVHRRNLRRPDCATSDRDVLGDWAPGQRDLFDLMAAWDAIRTNADAVPQSLRSFLR